LDLRKINYLRFDFTELNDFLSDFRGNLHTVFFTEVNDILSDFTELNYLTADFTEANDLPSGSSN